MLKYLSFENKEIPKNRNQLSAEKVFPLTKETKFKEADKLTGFLFSYVQVQLVEN